MISIPRGTWQAAGMAQGHSELLEAATVYPVMPKSYHLDKAAAAAAAGSMLCQTRQTLGGYFSRFTHPLHTQFLILQPYTLATCRSCPGKRSPLLWWSSFQIEAINEILCLNWTCLESEERFIRLKQTHQWLQAPEREKSLNTPQGAQRKQIHSGAGEA